MSHWRLARSVSRAGQIGVVSGTALDIVMARRLQDGDPGGHLRRGLSHFPVPAVAERIIDRYFLPRGRAPGKSYRSPPMFSIDPSRELLELTVAANFVEVFLAKSNHRGVVGINYLEKIQMPLLASLYGSLLAGVDYVFMGAGIPRAIPGIIDRLIQHEPATQKLAVEGAGRDEEFLMRLDPNQIVPAPVAPLKRPIFVAIVASNVLATTLARKTNGGVNGFVVEGPTSGGHNAPPRGPLTLNQAGMPLYGPRDVVRLDEIAKLGLPFWLAGSMGNSQSLRAALAAGATGIQLGTAFAYCRESGIGPEYKAAILQKVLNGNARVHTDPRASPTGFPFKLVQFEDTVSEQETYEDRPRLCDLGYLRTHYRREDGSLGYRCASEPVDAYVRKGGNLEDVDGRKCLCNCLLANIELGQRRQDGYQEKPGITSGDDLVNLGRLMANGRTKYSAVDVIRNLLAPASDPGE